MGRYRDTEYVINRGNVVDHVFPPMLEQVQIKEFVARFAINSTVSCFQFDDGKVKWDENPPALSAGTYAFFVLAPLTACGVLLLVPCALLCAWCDAQQQIL